MEEKSETGMKFAAGNCRITPDPPVFLAGFGARTAPTGQVLDHLYARMVLVSGSKDLLMIALDVLGADRGFVDEIKLELHRAYGLSADCVLLNFSHTHASVFLTGEQEEHRRGDYSIGQQIWPLDEQEIDYTRDMAYAADVKRKLLALAGDCYARLQTGGLALGTGETSIAISRRKRVPEGIVRAPAPEEEIDTVLSVWRLSDTTGKTGAVLFSCACHPTSMGPEHNAISAEFPGRACEKLEEKFPGAIAIYLQGCAADVRPRMSVSGEQFKSCTPSEMRQIGEELAEDVQRVLTEEMYAVQGPFLTALSTIDLQIGQDQDAIEQMLAGEWGDYYFYAASRIRNASERGMVRTKMGFYIQTWRLDKDVWMIALESEVPTAYAAMLRRQYPDKKLIILGYSNGVYSYVPTRRIASEGGYETDHPFLIGYAGRILPEAEERIMDRIHHQLLLTASH
jgi:neutral ceramidase